MCLFLKIWLFRYFLVNTPIAFVHVICASTFFRQWLAASGFRWLSISFVNLLLPFEPAQPMLYSLFLCIDVFVYIFVLNLLFCIHTYTIHIYTLLTSFAISHSLFFLSWLSSPNILTLSSAFIPTLAQFRFVPGSSMC